MHSSRALTLSATCALVVACSDDGRVDTDTAPVPATTGGSVNPSAPTGGDDTATTSPGATDPSGTGTGSVDPTEDPTSTTAGTTVDPSTGDTGTTGVGEDPIVSIEIEPLDAVFTVVDGQLPAPQEYKAWGVTGMGNKVPVTGAWTYDRPDIATIGGQSGSLTVSGLVGGKGNLYFDGSGELPEVATTATVKLVFNSDPDGVDPGLKDMFGAAVDPDPTLNLLYPYDKTVFPRGLTGPVIQWDGGNPDDLYYVHAFNDYFEFTRSEPQTLEISGVIRIPWNRLQHLSTRLRAVSLRAAGSRRSPLGGRGACSARSS